MKIIKKNQVVKEAFTELAPRYEVVLNHELELFWGWSYQEYVNQIVEQTELGKNQKILDIATGTAKIPRTIIQKTFPGIHIAGLDFTESMLLYGKKSMSSSIFPNIISLTCGDAMAVPFAAESFDVIITGLASHHMDISRMLNEIKRTIKKNGVLSMIDVGVSPIWHFPVVRVISRVIAFVYFAINENLTRARSEAAAITNVKTSKEWFEILTNHGYTNIVIEEISVPRKWLPTPMTIKALCP